MLRSLALALLLGNVLLWAYLHGHLALLGLPAHDPREPERLAQQVQPELLRVLNAAVDPAAPASALAAADASALAPLAPTPAPVLPIPASPAAPAPTPASEPTPTGTPAIPATAPPAAPVGAAPALVPPASAPASAPALGAAAAVAAAQVGTAAPSAAPALPPQRVPTAPALAGVPAPTPAAAPNAPVPAHARPGAERACWQASGLSPPEAALVRAALEARPDLAGRWNLSEVRVPARWLVYIGPLASEAALQRRRAELTRAGIEHRSLPPPLAPGLALGTFSVRAGAERALATLRARGVTDARVLQERPEGASQRLLLSAISSAERREIEAKAILPPDALRPCP